MEPLVTTSASRTKGAIIAYVNLDISSDPIELRAKVSHTSFLVKKFRFTRVNISLLVMEGSGSATIKYRSPSQVPRGRGNS